jgi:hypothetical protein
MQDTELDPRQANGTRPEPPRVAFGPGKTQNVPAEWAATMLATSFADEAAGRKPRPFSALLTAAAQEAR